MADKLKNTLFQLEKVQHFARVLKEAYPAFKGKN